MKTSLAVATTAAVLLLLLLLLVPILFIRHRRVVCSLTLITPRWPGNAGRWRAGTRANYSCRLQESIITSAARYAVRQPALTRDFTGDGACVSVGSIGRLYCRPDFAPEQDRR